MAVTACALVCAHPDAFYNVGSIHGSTPPRRTILDSPTSIAIIRPSSLGDVVRAVPALASVRRAYPNARIDWIVNDTFAPAISHHPALSNVIPFPRKRIGDHLRRAEFGPVLNWLETLREPNYDLTIDLQGLFRSGVMSYATGAPRRFGFANARELGWLGYTQRIRTNPASSHIDQNFELLSAIGIAPVRDLRLYPDPADQAAIAADPRLCSRFVLISPATRGAGRAWPIERFASVAEQLLQRLHSLSLEAIVVIGLPAEAEYCRPITRLAESDARLINLVGQTSISRLMAVLERSALVVCNDSAAMHMAVAFDRPLIALLGPTNMTYAGPYGRATDVISHAAPGEQVRHRDVPKAIEFMRRITTEEVLAACIARLDNNDTATQRHSETGENGKADSAS